MFTKRDRARLDNTKECIDFLTRSYNSGKEYLKTQYNELIERARKAESENISLRTKVDLYERYIQNITDKNTNTFDKIFMFDGELYLLTSRTVYEEPGSIKTISADFECLTNITKDFKKD